MTRSIQRLWLAALALAFATTAGSLAAPQAKTIKVTFTNGTENTVQFHLNGGKGLDASLPAGKTGSFTVIVDPTAAPIITIQQPKKGTLAFTLEDGGDYVFRLDGTEIKNTYKKGFQRADVCSAPQVGKTVRETGGGAAPQGFSLAGDIDRRWADRTNLKVSFIGGNAELREQVEHYAKQWGYYANLYFDFGDSKDADIRVAFEPKEQWYSSIGKDSLNVPKTKPTMVLGATATTDRESMRRHTIHEFGHAIGFIHEHQSPKAGISWNEKKVIEDCKRDQGWDEKDTRHNIFDAYKGGSVNASTFDPKSIMLYSFPKEWTTNGISSKWNTSLSELDKRHAARLYPWTPHSLIRISNESGKTVTFKRRWAGTEKWYSKELDAGESGDFWSNAGKAEKYAAFEIQFNVAGKTVTQTLASTDWQPKQTGDYPDFTKATAHRFLLKDGKLSIVSSKPLDR